MSLSAKFGCVLMIAAIVLAPRLLGPVLFPLHDIGFNLETLADLDRVATPWEYLETAARHRPERFFPAYWLGQHMLWRLGGRSLALLPLGNLVLLAALLWAVGRLARRVGGHPAVAMVLLLASPGMVENSHTFMKQELPLAAAQAFLALLLLESEKRPGIRTWGGAFLLLCFSGLLKETACLAGIALILWTAWCRIDGGARLARPGVHLLLALAALGLGVAAFLGRRPGPYTQAFSFSLPRLLEIAGTYARTLWPWLLYLPGAAVLLLAAPGSRDRGERQALRLVALLLAGWTAIYLFWATTQIRYFLPAFAFLAPLGAAAWARCGDRRPRAAAGAALFLMGLMVSLPTAVERALVESGTRLAADRALAELRGWMGGLPPGERLVFLLNEDEPIQELRAQMAHVHGRPDLRLEPALTGRSLGEWARSLAALGREVEPGQAILVPFSAGLPAYADRAFVVDDFWSNGLADAERLLLGENTRLEMRFEERWGPARAGFRLLRGIR